MRGVLAFLSSRFLVLSVIGLTLSFLIRYRFHVSVRETTLTSSTGEEIWDKLMDWEKLSTRPHSYIYAIKRLPPASPSSPTKLLVRVPVIGLERQAVLMSFREDDDGKRLMCFQYETPLSRVWLLQELDCLQLRIVTAKEKQERNRKIKEEEDEDEDDDEKEHKHKQKSVNDEEEGGEEVQFKLWKWYLGPLSLFYHLFWYEEQQGLLDAFHRDLEEMFNV